MVTVTIRIPSELQDRVKEISARDFAGDSATFRRLLRLGLEADERREQVDGLHSCQAAVS